MLTAQDVVVRILENIGAARRPDTVDALLAGDPDAPVAGVAVTMMATFDVLRRAVAEGLDLVITHEPLYYDHRNDAEPRLAAEDDPVYRAKASFVAEHGLRVWHLHDAWHDRRPDGVDEGTARALGWAGREVPGAAGVYVVEPTTLGELAAHVASALGARALRFVGDPGLPVSRAGLDLGFRGFERNRHLLQRADVDVAVIGEGHEWETGAYAADLEAAGIRKGLVVVGHVPSEQEGMAEAARWLADLLPEVPVRFVPAADPYRTLGA
ncbi:Nif3-like dinuclear metal center hexameric protein [Luteimicrobium sp. DT211]|uniref:Nif3-like dinuclear metal center hexameric protein n=1 Tax=Luteimicrobium sp. DT211 TaxID=3393412 RepID=UPI003CF4E183